MRDNHWQMTTYPFVPGHEIVGVIEEVGSQVTHLQPGQRVGAGWFSGSCMHCDLCMAGDHNLCRSAEQIIVGRYGGFADRVRVNAEWVFPLPDQLDATAAGPLFCGGITVFNPILQCDVQPTHRVGVIGIGGLGHLALQFLNAWGCEVTAFSSSPDKEQDARGYGAHHFVNSREDAALDAVAGQFDFILSTVNASLNWDKYIAALDARGRMHFVGAVGEPLSISMFSLMGGQKSVSATPLGSPATIQRMLNFCVRHEIAPKVKVYPFAEANQALAELVEQKPAHRLVLTHS
jgi:uncharacterized zinc-type alcohol dehydrogenase-like protein